MLLMLYGPSILVMYSSLYLVSAYNQPCTKHLVIVTATLRNKQSPSLFYKKRNTCIEGTKIYTPSESPLEIAGSRIQIPDLSSKLTQLVYEERGRKREKEGN